MGYLSRLAKGGVAGLGGKRPPAQGKRSELICKKNASPQKRGTQKKKDGASF